MNQDRNIDNTIPHIVIRRNYFARFDSISFYRFAAFITQCVKRQEIVIKGFNPPLNIQIIMFAIDYSGINGQRPCSTTSPHSQQRHPFQ